MHICAQPCNAGLHPSLSLQSSPSSSSLALSPPAPAIITPSPAMRPNVLEHRRCVVNVWGCGVPASSIFGLPGYNEASSGGWRRVAVVALRHRVKYQWVTRRPGCAHAEVYRQTDFMAFDDPPVCYSTFVLHWGDLLEGLVGCRYEEPEVQAAVCYAVRTSTAELLQRGRGRRESALLEVEVETTTVLSYDWVRWWLPVPCALPRSSAAPAKKGHPIEDLEMEVYAEDEEHGTEACAICLDDFVPGAEVERLPCRHLFHGECIVRWLEDDGSCPMCRSEFRIK